MQSKPDIMRSILYYRALVRNETNSEISHITTLQLAPETVLEILGAKCNAHKLQDNDNTIMQWKV